MRLLKIQSRVRRAKRYYYGQRLFSFFPSLHLSGKWFRQAGFEIGQRVQVEVQDGRIILTPMQDA
jgi:hypothetical protein